MLKSVGARLMLAFAAISSFSLVAATSGVWSLTQVDQSLRLVTDVRVPQALALTEVSRQAERLLRAAPALLVVTNETVRASVSSTLRNESDALLRLIREADSSANQVGKPQSLPTNLADSFYANLINLDRLVERRLATSKMRAALSQKLSRATTVATRLVVPAERILRGQLSEWNIADSNGSVDTSEKQTRLARSIISLLPQTDVLVKIDNVDTELRKVANAQTAEEVDVLSFGVNRAIAEVEQVAGVVPKRVLPRLLRQFKNLNELSAGPNSLARVRKREIALIDAGEELLAENTRLAAALGESIRRTVGEARGAIDDAKNQAISVRVINTKFLIAVGAMSILASLLIAWFYVNQNLIARLQQLSTSMLAIAGGALKSNLPSPGTDDEIGRMASALIVFRDTAVEVQQSNLTEIENARRTLLEAIENSSEGFALYDLDEQLVVCNSRYRDIMLGDSAGHLPEGTALDQVIGRAARSGRFPDAMPDHDAWVLKQMVRHQTAECQFVQALESNQWLQVSIRRTGQAGTVVVQSDISEIKRISDELMRAKDAAEAANEAKSAFLATMSHEVRTPLNGIVGMSTLLSSTNLDAEQSDYTATINEASDSLLTIINDILDFSKVDAGALDLERVPVDLTDIVESSIDLLSAKASEKGIEFACQISAEVPATILGDPTRLKQILLNLLTNAIKFTDVGEVILSVSSAASESPDADASLVFEISDTGIGIPADRMDRLFKSFSQVDPSTSRRYGGTGLGLVITKRLVELMGGTINVASEKGSGTTFTFRLPANMAPAADQAVIDKQLERFESIRILVVDDSQTNLAIMADKLRGWRIQTEVVSLPSQAMCRLAQGIDFDAIIIDFSMPEMDGVELCNQIGAIYGTQAPAMILYSSVSLFQPELRRRIENSGFAAQLMKPARSGQLLKALTNAIWPDLVTIERVRPSVKAQNNGLPANLSMLLVDDNAINRKIGRKILNHLGYQPDVVNSGPEAVLACQSKRFDAVFMDIEMPDMDGLEATAKIRASLAAKQAPYIVALTANAMASDRESYLRSGMDDYLSKPIDLAALTHCLSAAAQRRSEQQMGADLRISG